MAQAVSCWLPTAVDHVCAMSSHVGFVVDKVALARVFSEYFGFIANHHSTEFSILIITRGRYNKANW
jgi:hypothetical protein